MLLSVALGVILGAVYHFSSVKLQKWVSSRPFAMVPLVTVGGFIGRLAVFVGILAVLGLWTPLNILVLCLAFVVVLTVLNGIWLYSFVSKRHGAPPTTGAGSVL